MRLIDITGKRYGRLIAIKYSHTHKKTHFWLFKCDCGNDKITRKHDVTFGKIQSCGCFMREVKATYGCSKERLYKIWWGLLKRCYQSHTREYSRYGGRGIKVCDEWKNDYLVFKKWALENGYSDELSIDRIDNDGNYEPSNCRWATDKEQNRNMGKYNINITLNNVTKTASEWARELNLSFPLICRRFAKGWSPEHVLSLDKFRPYGRKSLHKTKNGYGVGLC